jgi:hypothetical protein
MRRKIKIILLLLAPVFVFSQMPDTEVWLFEIKKEKTGAYAVAEPINVSQRKGYDNQPAFSADSKTLYYTSDANTQNDIYAYSIRSKKNLRLTSTSESEYSPRIVPGTQLLSAVVVEKDSSQRLQFFNSLDGTYSRKLSTDSIGYYYFLNNDTVVFFKLTEPSSLRWRTTSDSTEHFLGFKPTRCFQAVNRHTLVYGRKDSASVEYYRYDFLLRRATKLATHVPGSEDLFWHRDLGLMIAYKNEILRYNEQTKSWDVLFNFSSFGMRKITRFVIDPSAKRLALVDNPE